MQRYRIVALMNCNNLKDAEKCLASLGDLNDDIYFYENYHKENKYPGKTGSLVPFPLRIISAELKPLLAPEAGKFAGTNNYIYQS